MLNNHHAEFEDTLPELKVTAKALTKAEAPGINNEPADHVQAGTIYTMKKLNSVCIKIRQVRIWSTPLSIADLENSSERSFSTVQSLISKPHKVESHFNRLKLRTNQIFCDKRRYSELRAVPS